MRPANYQYLLIDNCDKRFNTYGKYWNSLITQKISQMKHILSNRRYAGILAAVKTYVLVTFFEQMTHPSIDELLIAHGVLPIFKLLTFTYQMLGNSVFVLFCNWMLSWTS